jgi:outer membrane protein OmpA-like peptidoglycan-associated protein
VTPLLGVAAVALVAWLNQGEAPTDRVVLLPDEGGKAGKLVVKSAGSEETLATPYAGARIGAGGRIEARTEDADEVRRRYANVLAAQPPKPANYRVYFVSGGEDLTPESTTAIAELKAELARRPVPEIMVVGHTDRVGAVEANDALSIKRAEAVRQLLIGQGVRASAIETAGRGEREPLTPTADEVAEARNRRVEINLR